MRATMAAVVVLPFVAEISADPLRQAGREPVDGARIQLPEQLSGHRRAPAGPDDAGESCRRACEHDLGGER